MTGGPARVAPAFATTLAMLLGRPNRGKRMATAVEQDSAGPGAGGGVQPGANETRDRIATGTITVLPIIGLGIAAWQAWQGWLHFHDIVVFVIAYLATGFGVTVGFPRLFTHRSFKTKPAVKTTLAILGSTAIEGPIISWVADHRKHHAFSDQEGD